MLAFACTPSHVGCPSFTLCQELNTDGRFERSMVEHRSHLPSPRVERCGVFDGSPAVSSNAATQGLGRKEYGAGTDPTEREWQPYMSVVRLIRMGRSGDNLESGDFSYGRYVRYMCGSCTYASRRASGVPRVRRACGPPFACTRNTPRKRRVNRTRNMRAHAPFRCATAQVASLEALNGHPCYYTTSLASRANNHLPSKSRAQRRYALACREDASEP